MRSYSEYICQQCGYKSSSFLGKCPNCGEWNSLVETEVSTDSSKFLGRWQAGKVQSSKFEESLIRLAQVKSQDIRRLRTGFLEFDRVLGGGIVPGSIVLISGEPGIGKSTLLLQAAMQIAKVKVESRKSKSDTKDQKPSTSHFDSPSVLYVTAEESAQQVKIRADRIAKTPDSLYILPVTQVEAIVVACEKIKPTLVIVDSIQTITTDKLSGSAGSVGQVRECSQILQRLAKSSGIPVIVVGHVTKEGTVAGPKVLEHLVDAVCHLEGDGMHTFRLLRSLKNRFGSTFEVGVFEMHDDGLVEVSNPSQIFLAQRLKDHSGSVVTATIAGGRPLLAEVQALTTATIFGIPTRRVTGLDFSRIQIVIAALSKAAKLALANLDVYVNVAGGLKIAEPAADLAAAIAIASAVVDKPLRLHACVFGEVGLLGELRPVANFKNRADEAKRLGYREIISAEKFRTLAEAIRYAIH